jgi:multidrug efflux pump subunit AcrB/ABC-type multidrug transport system ATPase subunit
MFFLGIVLVGVIASQRMPVELFPSITGDTIFVNFRRPGSDPEVIEREILMPLHARVSAMPLVAESWGEIRGSGGSYRVRFEPSAELKVRELELQRVAAALQREQPRGTFINVQSADTSAFSSFVMRIHVLGGDAEDQNSLHDLALELIAPRFAAVPGVSQVLTIGGARRQVTVSVDPDRLMALGMTTEAVTQAVNRNVGQLQFLGSLESEAGRTAVMLDGRPKGLVSLGEALIDFDRAVRLRHVSELSLGPGREESRFRVNGQPAVGIVIYQEQGSNLVRLGRQLRERLSEVQADLQPIGISLVMGTDAADDIDEQIGHLANLGATGFVIALAVLFLFLRQWRAVAVVGVAVPVSLLVALSLLYLSGQSLNLITLFGLALAVGLVVDNSVVVYEAVLRQLEHGADAETAVLTGLRRTVRAILAASATTAVVFLPLMLVDFDDVMISAIVKIVTLSILLPLAGSLLVAVGLVPMLAQRLAAPAAIRKFAEAHERRVERGGLVAPDRARLFFGGIVAGALRHPPAWLTGVTVAVILTTIIAVPWTVAFSGSQAVNAETVQRAIRFPGGRTSMEAASTAMGQLEAAVLDLEGVEMVEVMVQEEGGSITVHLAEPEQWPVGFGPGKVTAAIFAAAKKARGLRVLNSADEQAGGGRGGGGGRDASSIFGGSPAEIVLSGPDSGQLENLAASVRSQLESMPQVTQAWLSAEEGLAELWVSPNQRAFESFGLTFDQVLPVLSLAGREGERSANEFVLPNGRELPVLIERKNARRPNGATSDLRRLRVSTDVGVVPVMALTTIARMPAPTTIVHHNGRREISVFYRLFDGLPETGPGRIAIEEQIAAAIRAVPRPNGYTVETNQEQTSTSILKQVIVPVVALLFLVLAMAFESLILPALVLLALPLTLLGATWALVLAGVPLDMMAMMGAVALIGLTVNPAILLVDRMQQRVLHGGWSAGAAAFASVRERARPVLMTTATTVAGLWPLALTTGRENEIWPPFATIVIGGLVTSSLLTLLIIPVGFILLQKLEEIFSRVGPWLVLSWLGSTTLLMIALIFSEVITSLLWQVVLSFLIGGSLLAVVVLVFRPRTLAAPDCSHGPPTLDVRSLYKTYGLPGSLRKTLRASQSFAARVLQRGGRAFHVEDARAHLVPLLLGTLGVGYLSLQLQSEFWRLVFWLAGAALLSRFVLEVRRARGLADSLGVVRSGGIENVLAPLIPWLAIGVFAAIALTDVGFAREYLAGALVLPGFAVVVLAAIQSARRSARRQTAGELERRAMRGTMRTLRTLWRRIAARIAGMDLPIDSVRALEGVNFVVKRGMVGVLGPNGAGKSTLLRQLAGVVDPSRGTIHLGGVPLKQIQHQLARWVGYLPQEAGLPDGLTAREYLSYYAALYDLEPDQRDARVDSLLTEVGLSQKMDEPIKALSGGMRQRVAVARTLLRLPSVIIVDEPTVGLDPAERIRFRNLLARLARERIVMFSTHVVEDVAVACERVLVLADGRLLFDGEPAALTEIAQGHVWELRMAPDADWQLPAGAIQAEETPTADGTVVRRILAETEPNAATRSLAATLEDGYMWLLANDRADLAA